MARGTFVIHAIERFPEKDELTTEKEPVYPASVWEDDSLFSKIRLAVPSTVTGFEFAVVTHRSALKKGDHESEQWVCQGKSIPYLVIERNFPAYYKREKNLFISWGEKKIVLNAIKIFNNEFRDKFRLNIIDFDLEKIKEEISSNDDELAVIKSGWIKRTDSASIQNMAVFGKEIKGDKEFEAILEKGDLVNLKAAFPFNQRGVEVSIAKSGSIYFIDDYPLETCLEFMEHLATEFKIKSQKSG